MWWIRKYIRSKMNPIEPHVARAWKVKLSYIYAAVAWNTFAFAVFLVVKDVAPRTKSSSVDYAKLLAVKDAKVVKFSNFNKSNEFDIKLNDEEIDEFFQK